MSTESETKSKNEYNDIVQREKELKSQIQSKRANTSTQEKHKLPIRTWITDTITGEVIDMDYNKWSSTLTLNIRVSSGEVVDVRVDDSGDYEETNELVRVLEWYDIKNGEFGNLIGQKVKLESNDIIYRRKNKVKNINWSVYVPDDLDFFGRNFHRTDGILKKLGVSKFEKYAIGEFDDLFLAFLMGIMFICIIVALYLSYIIVFFALSVVSPVLHIGTALLFTILTPIIVKYGAELKGKYQDYRNSDALKS